MPVWEALSTFYIDNDIDIFTDYVTSELSKSRYSLDELEQILIYEVHPICKWNLLAFPGGEWDGFDPDWLKRKIMARLKSPFRGYHWINIGRITIPLSSHWRHVKRVVKLKRENTC